MRNVVDKIMAPKDIHILIPRICEYVSLPDKRDLEDVIKLSILIWGDYAGFSGWAQCNHRVLTTGRQKLQSQKMKM